MSDLVAAENTLHSNLKGHLSVLDIVAQPWLNAAKQTATLNTRMMKEVLMATTDAATALGQGNWEPSAKLVKSLTTIHSPRTTEYTVALGQILGAANTQIFVNASWAGLGKQAETLNVAQTMLTPLVSNAIEPSQPAPPQLSSHQ
jgi:hypothetical protein